MGEDGSLLHHLCVLPVSPGSCSMDSESTGSPKCWGTETHCPQTIVGKTPVNHNK